MYDGDYIERLLLFEKPLTSRFRKKYVEFLALEILQYCYGDFYKKFNVYDSPDLCDKERVVGIEVTEAVTIEEAQIKSEFVKYRLENDNSKKERRRQIIENNGGRVEKFGLSYPVKNSKSEIVTFQNAIRKKMEKLSLYRCRGFKTLGLFIFYDEPPIPIKIELLKECFDQVLNEYNDKYDFLYFGYSCGLVYYDIVNSDKMAGIKPPSPPKIWRFSSAHFYRKVISEKKICGTIS